MTAIDTALVRIATELERIGERVYRLERDLHALRLQLEHGPRLPRVKVGRGVVFHLPERG